MSVDNLYLKYLIRSHTLLGIFVVFIFYISTYFGTITLFKPYLKNWESPSHHFKVVENTEPDLDKAIRAGLKELNNPNDRVQITLPSFNEKTLSIKFGFSEKIYIDPYTNKVIDTKNENSFISNFFNQMHISLDTPPIGQILMGIVSISIVFLTISGIYLWLINRPKRSNKKVGFWFRWHKDLSLLLLPYILVFSLTGAVLGVMILSATPFVYSASQGEETHISKVVRPIIYPRQGYAKKSGVPASMQKFSILYDKAQKNYPNLNITNISLNSWNDKNARIVFSGYLDENKILSSRANRATIVLSGASGEILEKKGIEDTHIISQVMSGFYFFHFISDEGIIVRLIYLILGLVFGLSMIFGIYIWLEKKIQRYGEDGSFYKYLSQFSTALTIGVIPASAFILFIYWLLPFNYIDKETWLKGGFYALWCFTLFYSVYKNDMLSILKLFAKLSGIFLLLAVILHQLRTNVFLWDSFQKNMDAIFWVDTSLLLLAIASLLFAKNIERIKFLQKIRGF